ncbi:ribokinase [Sulfurimonas sp.]|uniref:ribokinase n=1 Tax=Sulfurimonas sp. TaxID=2022749 RepID=UPI003565169E
MNFGSINIDYVYSVEHFVRPGETLKSDNYTIFSGGKGANQSIALARAKAEVIHAGKIGNDGAWLKEKLQKSGVNTSLIKTIDTPTGHAVIQVNKDGENAIIIHGGANQTFTDAEIEEVLDSCEAGDFLLLQNEINAVGKILQKSQNRDLTVIFNPAPITDAIQNYPLEFVDIFIINEVEGETLTKQKSPDAILNTMQKLYPKSKTVLTLGKAGVIYTHNEQRIKTAALKVKAVDTTGAGDTFIGYFLAELSRGSKIEKCLEMGTRASAICVTRKGAADSIPKLEEII